MEALDDDMRARRGQGPSTSAGAGAGASASASTSSGTDFLRPFSSFARGEPAEASTSFASTTSNTSGRSSTSELGSTISRIQSIDPVAAAKWHAEVEALRALLKVRDFAFPEQDPRHVGARDVGSAPEKGDPPQAGSVDDEEQQDWGVDANDAEAAGDDDALPEGLYQVLYAFAAESEHELNVQPGDRVRVVGHLDGGWSIVERAANQKGIAAESERGLVPESYLEWISEESP